MKNNNSDQQHCPTKASSNPWGLCVLQFNVCNLPSNNHNYFKICLGKQWCIYSLKALHRFHGICIFIVDGTLLLIGSPQRRDKLVWYRDKIIRISVFAASIGSSLFSFYKAKQNTFGTIIIGIIIKILGKFHIFMATVIVIDIIIFKSIVSSRRNTILLVRSLLVLSLNFWEIFTSSWLLWL